MGHHEASQTPHHAEIRYRFVVDVQINPEDKPPAGVRSRDLREGLVAKMNAIEPRRGDVQFFPKRDDGSTACVPATDTCDDVILTESINAQANPAGVAFYLKIRSSKHRHREVHIPEQGDSSCDDPQEMATSWFSCPGGWAGKVVRDLEEHIDSAHSARQGERT